MSFQIQPGDRFMKSGGNESQSIWEVERMVENPDHPLHVRLVKISDKTRVINLAASVLAEKRLYRRVVD